MNIKSRWVITESQFTRLCQVCPQYFERTKRRDIWRRVHRECQLDITRTLDALCYRDVLLWMLDEMTEAYDSGQQWSVTLAAALNKPWRELSSEGIVAAFIEWKEMSNNA